MFELLLGSGSPPLWDVTFHGEQPATNLIDGVTLANVVGLVGGTDINNDSSWLHFDVEGTTLYIAKLPLKHTVSWDILNTVGLVYGGEVYEYNGLLFTVRLLTGSDKDPANQPGGEWTNVLGRVLRGRDLGDYTPAQLGHGSSTVGRNNWTQEMLSGQEANRVWRGGTDGSSFGSASSNTASNAYGWRPVLELIDPSKWVWPLANLYYITEYVKAMRPYEWEYTD